jgi:hypothetical protein
MCVDFRVRPAEFPMPAPTDNLPIFNNDHPNGRVRLDITETTMGKPQCNLHIFFVGGHIIS